MEEIYKQRKEFRKNHPLLTSRQVADLATPSSFVAYRYIPAGFESSDTGECYWRDEENVSRQKSERINDNFESERALGIGQNLTDLDLWNDIYLQPCRIYPPP